MNCRISPTHTVQLLLCLALAGAATPATRAQSAAVPPAATEIAQPPVTVLEETLLTVRTIEPINSKRVKEGSPLLFLVSQDLRVGDQLAVPRGARVHGQVVRSKKSGMLAGSPELTLKLTSLDLGGRSYPLDSYPFHVQGTSKSGATESKALRGAVIGAVVGSMTSGISAKGGLVSSSSSPATGMAVDAAIGAGVGTAASAATPGPGLWIPSESEIYFYLAAPVTVTPVSAKDAARLAQGLHSGGPALYVRGDPH